ncbi:CHRD domain-containing protein [Polaromonas jejuensis]|uniref:CHRD domain-containing protein n=1 Tax=Polaromonas jejuensis TaxID=457502 RepID=A0ABW0QFJ5_9BURK|nr:CHRD domain-containing protein [Polaromonas jejuensis]
MPTRRQAIRISLAAMTVLAAAAITGCGMMGSQSNLVAFTTQLRAANEVPPNTSRASGSVDAVFNKDTNLFRWKVKFTGLTGPATGAHFHGPAAIGSNAGVVLPWTGPITSPLEGSATLTPAQAADLMAGRWYANVHTAANPGGEIRGQMTVVTSEPRSGGSGGGGY